MRQANEWGAALATAESLLRADLDLMSTTRSALSALAARSSIRTDLRLLNALLDGLESEAPDRLADSGPRLAAVAAVLDQWPEPDMAAARTVVTEYVYVTTALREVSRQRGWSVLLLDPERTIALANPYFHALMRFCRSPSTEAPPPFPRFSRHGLGWWLYDPAGKLLLDAALLDLVPAIRDMEKQRVEIEAAREDLRQRLRALHSRAGRAGRR